MNDMLIVFFSIILTENYSLTRFFSFMPIDEEEDGTKNLGALGLVLSIILVISVSIMYPIYNILFRFNLIYLYAFLSVIIILLVSRLVKFLLPIIYSPLYDLIKNSLLIITINSTLLGTVLVTMESNESFLQAVVAALAAGIGYTLAVMIFQGISFRIKESNIASVFQGTPILLVSAFIASIAFEGFSGIFLGMFK